MNKTEELRARIKVCYDKLETIKTADWIPDNIKKDYANAIIIVISNIHKMDLYNAEDRLIQVEALIDRGLLIHKYKQEEENGN